MKDEVRRISKLVAEGRLSPEDAADLIDAFYAGQLESESESRAESASAGAATPPPPPGSTARDNFKSFVDTVERMTKEGIDSVNWNEVATQARNLSKKSIDAVRASIEDISKGKVNLSWLRSVETKDVTMPFSIPAGKSLRVENPAGNVKVVGGFDSGTVVASAKVRGASLEDAKLKADSYSLIIEESEAWVVIRQPEMSGLSVELEIQMAGSGAVEIRGESGDVHVLDTRGSCRVVTRSGNVFVRGLNGAIELNTESGDLSVEDSASQSIVLENKSGDVMVRNAQGNLNLRTQSGNVQVKSSAGKVMSIETVQGNVLVDDEKPVAGNVNIRTVSGNTLLTVPDGCDCRVSLSTLRGTVRSNLELTDARTTEQRVSGRLGSGNGSIDVSAVMGNVVLEQRDSATA